LDPDVGVWEALTGLNPGRRSTFRREKRRGGARHEHARAREPTDVGKFDRRRMPRE
jgi:hypothetical protein